MIEAVFFYTFTTLMLAAAPLFAVYGLSLLIAWRFEAPSGAGTPDLSAP